MSCQKTKFLRLIFAAIFFMALQTRAQKTESPKKYDLFQYFMEIGSQTYLALSHVMIGHQQKAPETKPIEKINDLSLATTPLPQQRTP